jgi:hypothetical protein
MSLVQVTKTYVVCPHCEGSSGATIDHLIKDRRERTWGPWYCEQCDNAFQGTAHADGSVTVEKVTRERFVKQFNLLCLPPQKEPVYFVTATRHFEGSTLDQMEFYYESSSCPTNWLRDIGMISIGGDQDPHGLFKYMGSLPFDEERDDRWDEIFPVIGSIP